MVERLVQLDRVQPDFDPLTWMQDVQRMTKDLDQVRLSQRNLELDISLRSNYKAAITAHKKTPAYKKLMKDKPSGKKKAVPKLGTTRRKSSW